MDSKLLAALLQKIEGIGSKAKGMFRGKGATSQATGAENFADEAVRARENAKRFGGDDIRGQAFRTGSANGPAMGAGAGTGGPLGAPNVMRPFSRDEKLRQMWARLSPEQKQALMAGGAFAGGMGAGAGLDELMSD